MRRSPEEDATVDVVVVGAGLAGLEVSRRLAEAGASVLLADRKRDVAERVHTTGIFVRQTLESFDLPESCLGPPVRKVALYSPSGRRLELESPHDEFRVGRMQLLYRSGLEACLVAGVRWSASTAFVGADQGEGGTIVLLEGPSGPWLVRARFVIGADGAVSRVAPALGLDSNREWIAGVEDVFHRSAGEGEPAFHCWLDPELAPGYIAWVVDDGEETHVGVAGYSRRFEPARSLRLFTDRVADRFGLGDARPDERRGGRIPVGGVLPRIVNERGLLVGDAAGAVSPLTAGGLDPCLRQSALAADVASAYLRSGDAGALARYDGTYLRTRFRKRLLLRRALAAVRSPAMAELALLALKVPPFTGLARHVFFGRGSFPDVPTAESH